MLWEVSDIHTWVYGGSATWEFVPTYNRDGRDMIHRYCEGVARVWNATKVSAHEYAPTDKVVVIICNLGYVMVVDIYRKQRDWEVFRRWISSCDDLLYVVPVVRRVLAREGFSDVDDVMNYIAEHWIGLIRRWTRL